MRRLLTAFRAWRARRRYSRTYARLLEQGHKHLPHLDERRLSAWAEHHAKREIDGVRPAAPETPDTGKPDVGGPIPL